MVTWWQAILLGLVQGLTEFIPVSSSAHLNITHWLLGQDRNLTFDVLLHIGTLFALVFYFRHDWVELLRNPAQVKLRNLVILACIPAVIAGLLLRDAEEKLPIFVNPLFNATMLIVMGLLLGWADKVGSKERALEDVNLTDALVIGCSQALALVPGVSRSGSTITFGLFRRLTREAAARFSFLMSVPITLGATIFEARALFEPNAFASLKASPGIMLLGIVASALSGFWAIGFLLNYLKTKSVTLFVVWRIVVALLVFVVYFLTGGGPQPASNTKVKATGTETTSLIVPAKMTMLSPSINPLSGAAEN
jgi:undecaprenyl-diphosphatase